MRPAQIITAFLLLASCDLPPEAPTETGSDTTTDTTGDTGESTGDTTGELAEPFVLVLDQSSQIVGRLATPDASTVLDHDDVFAGIYKGGPRTLYLTLGPWGFQLVTAGPSFWPNAEPTGWVWYTDASCGFEVGHPFDTYSLASKASDCVDEPVPGGNYPDSQAFADMLALRWPEAAGVFVRRPGTDRFWMLPAAQEWPAMHTARSVRHDDESCTQLVDPIDVCGLRMLDATYWPISTGGPYKLIGGI
jgi:hypothetical protein